MIKNVQITGDPDTHPEKKVHDAYELASGQIDITKLGIAEHHARVFDLMDADDRSEYEKLYIELLNASKEGKILISSNSREVLSRPDGSTGWFKYIEWTVFDTSDILGA
jgi:hypothetical protein